MMSTTYLIGTKVSLDDQLRTVEQLIEGRVGTQHCTGKELSGLQATAESLRRLQKLHIAVVASNSPDPDEICNLVLDCLGNPQDAPPSS